MTKPNLSLLSQKVRQGGGNPGTVPAAASEMTAGQKSAVTRKQNEAARAGQTVPVTVLPAVGQPVPAVSNHLILTLVVTESDGGITCILECETPAADLPLGWSPNLSWTLRSTIGPDGFTGHEAVTVTLANATASELQAAGQCIGNLQAAIEADREGSEDESLPRTVSAICGHYLVTRLRLVSPDGTGSREVARGQSYRALTQLTDSMLARLQQAA